MGCDSCLRFQEHFSKFGGVEKVKLMSDQVGSFQLPIQEMRALYSLYRIVQVSQFCSNISGEL